MEQKNTHQPSNGTNDELELLGRLRSEVYDNSIEELALGLGRPVSQVSSWIVDGAEIDEDAAEKIHALAVMRLGEGGDSRGPEAAHDDGKNIHQRL